MAAAVPQPVGRSWQCLCGGKRTPFPASGSSPGREINLPAKKQVMHSSATAGVPQAPPAGCALACAFFGEVIGTEAG